jgi:ABC-type glycerol-3-phosphate transport system substrate-binding protein
MKKLLGFVLLLALSTQLFASGARESKDTIVSQFIEKDPTEYVGELSIWSFTDEPNYMIEQFNKKYPNVNVTFTHIPGGQNYITKINSAVSTKNAPDIFSAEVSFIKNWLDANVWADLSKAPYNCKEKTDQLIPYVVELAQDTEGGQRALSNQATPGGIYYRRSLAKKYLGTDDPAQIAEKMKDIDSYINLAKTIRDASNNEVHLFSSWKDLRWFPFNQRESSWVVNNTLVIDPVIDEYFDLAKTIVDEDLSCNIMPDTPSWYSAMADGSCMTYILPTWGLHFELKGGAEPFQEDPSKYSGDWAVTKSPVPFYWGGTWWGISKDTKVPELAWLFLDFLMFDQDYLLQYAKDKGDFVSNKITIESIKKDFKEPFLNGQNSYAFYADAAQNIDVSKVTKYDQHIEKMLLNAISLYVEGGKTKAEALKSLKTEVKNAFPELEVN